MYKWECSICGHVHSNNLPVAAWRKVARLLCKSCNRVTEHIREGIAAKVTEREMLETYFSQ